MIRAAFFFLAVALSASLATADTAPKAGSVAQDLQELEDAFTLLFGAPSNAPDDPLPEDIELTISLTAKAGSWFKEGDALPDNLLILPVDTLIALQITSSDLIYEMEFPELELEFTGIPGRIEVIYITFSETGLYSGNCSVSCGQASAPLIFDVRDPLQ